MLKLFRRNDDPRQALRHKLGDVEIPSFPETVARLLPMLRQEGVHAAEVAEVLQHDPGLHVLVLRTVNSAAYGLSSKVDSITRAVTLLGRARLESVVLSVAVRNTLPTGAPGFDADAFWLTAARRASVAKSLAALLHRETEAQCFTAGLLQDIGVPALLAAQGDPYRRIYDRWRAEPATHLSALEKDALGYDHQEIGALIAEQWRLPDQLVQAIACHHEEGGEGAAEPAVQLVARIRDSAGSDGADAVAADCEARFGIHRARAESLVAEAYRMAEEFAGALT